MTNETTVSAKAQELATALSGLAERINDAHRDCEKSARTAVSHAIRAGELLTKAKTLCGHGRWQVWVRDNCALSERTCRIYMRVAREVARLPKPKRQRVAVLSLRDTIKLLTAPTKHRPAVEALFRDVHGWYADAIDQIKSANGDWAEANKAFQRCDDNPIEGTAAMLFAAFKRKLSSSDQASDIAGLADLAEMAGELCGVIAEWRIRLERHLGHALNDVAQIFGQRAARDVANGRGDYIFEALREREAELASA